MEGKRKYKKQKEGKKRDLMVRKEVTPLGTKVWDKFSIERSKSMKTSDLIQRFRCRPILNGHHLGFVHMDP